MVLQVGGIAGSMPTAVSAGWAPDRIRRAPCPRPFLLAGLLIGFAVPHAHAQEPYSQVTILGGGVSNVGRSILHRWWKPGYGGEIALATPFHWGSLEGGLALHRYEATDRTVPTFRAGFIFVGWGAETTNTDTWAWYNGLRVGVYRMAFDERTRFPSTRRETEFTLGIHSRVDLHLSPTVHLYVAGHWMRTYTAPRFGATHLAGGLTWTFQSPDWLQTILR